MPSDKIITKQPVKQNDEPKLKRDSYPNWNIGRIFWGLLFILIGGLILASNMGWVEIKWNGLCQLWPLIIISSGLSIMSLRGTVGKALSAVLAAATLVAIAWSMIGGVPSSQQIITSEATVQKASVDVKSAEISLITGTSSINIDSADQSPVAKLKVKSNLFELSKSSNVVDGVQLVNISSKVKDNRWMSGGMDNSWDLLVTRALPLSLAMHVGASDVNADMSGALLRNMAVQTGASDINIKLGNKEKQVYLDVEAGLSSVLIKVPSDSGIRLEIDSGLTGKSIADLKQVGDNIFESNGYGSASNKINIVAEVGVSSFTIERY